MLLRKLARSKILLALLIFALALLLLSAIVVGLGNLQQKLAAEPEPLPTFAASPTPPDVPPEPTPESTLEASTNADGDSPETLTMSPTVTPTEESLVVAPQPTILRTGSALVSAAGVSVPIGDLQFSIRSETNLEPPVLVTVGIVAPDLIEKYNRPGHFVFALDTSLGNPTTLAAQPSPEQPPLYLTLTINYGQLPEIRDSGVLEVSHYIECGILSAVIFPLEKEPTNPPLQPYLSAPYRGCKQQEWLVSENDLANKQLHVTLHRIYIDSPSGMVERAPLGLTLDLSVSETDCRDYDFSPMARHNVYLPALGSGPPTGRYRNYYVLDHQGKYAWDGWWICK